MTIDCKRSMKVMTVYGVTGICLLALAATGITVVLAVDAIRAGNMGILIPLFITIPLIAVSLWMLPRYLNAVLRVEVRGNEMTFYTLLRRIPAIREQIRIASGRGGMMIGVRDKSGRVRVLRLMESFFKPGDAAALKKSLPE